MSKKYTKSTLYTNKNYYSKLLEDIFSEVCLIRREELLTEKKIMDELRKKGLYGKNNWGAVAIKDELFDRLVKLKDYNSKTKKKLYEQLIKLKIPNKTLNINEFFKEFVKNNKKAKNCKLEFWSFRDENRTYENLKNYLRIGKIRYEKLQNQN
jgi:hypothetical protein